MAVETTLKRWGNSMAVIVPMQLVQQKNLKENEKVVIEVAKKADLSDIFGLIKERKLSGKEAKDLARRGWESESDRQRWKK
jgi:antitoxin component of MazEF toxin-antitoxin module